MDRSVIDDFINRYEQGDPTQGYSEDEARSAFEQAVQTAPPETLRRAARDAVDRLDDGQRAEFGELLRTQQTEQPAWSQATEPTAPGLDDMFGGLFGSGGLGNFFGDLVSPGRSDGQQRGGRAGGGPNIGELLRNPVGRAVIGGIGAMALKQLMRQR